MALKKRMSVKAAKKNFLEKIIPIPQEFYAGNKDEDLIIPKKQIIPMAIVLQFMQWGAFIAFFTYYSLPPSFIRESTIQAEWDYGAPSWNCTPMMADHYYAVRWNYDTCKLLVKEPSETTVRSVADVAFNPMGGGHDDPTGMSGPTSGAAWRYYPFTGTIAYAKGAVGPAIQHLNNPSLDAAGQTAKIEEVFEAVKEHNACGLDGTPQYVYRDRADMIKSDEWTYDIFQSNLKLATLPPPPSPPPLSPSPPPPDMTNSVCCGGGETYDDEEPECKTGVFQHNGATTQCSNFGWDTNVGEVFSSMSGQEVIHTARKKDGSYWSVDDDAGDRSNKVAVTKLDRNGYYQTGQNDKCVEGDPSASPNTVNSPETACTFRSWSFSGSDTCVCHDGTLLGGSCDHLSNCGSTTNWNMVKNCKKCCKEDEASCGGPDNECNPDLCCWGCGMEGDHGGYSSDPMPTSDDPMYATFVYGLPEGYYYTCNTTQAEAIAMYKKYNEMNDPCEWAKHNGPFNCERAGPLGVGQRFSLAYANALLAYTLVSAAIVNIFFAAQKRRAEGRDVEEGEGEEEFKEVAAVEVNK